MNKLLIRLIVFLLILGLCIGGGWWWWNDATSPIDPSNTSLYSFTVSSGEGVRSIATRLKNEKIIKDQVGFFIGVKLLGLENKLQAGDFHLSSSMDTLMIIRELTHGTTDVRVTTLEGWRNEEIGLKLAQDLAIPEAEFLKIAKEGYMFPDTYLLPKEASAGAVVKIFLENFDKRITKNIRDAFFTQGLTLEEGIILASLVEREGRTDADRPVIAGILLNRFKADWPLQADATLQYALGYQSAQKSWWKKELTDEDKEVKSLYNTYAHVGLPPAPICNPGLASIKAVANPKKTDYWYYLHDKEGRVHFAETIEEHNTNTQKYLQK